MKFLFTLAFTFLFIPPAILKLFFISKKTASMLMRQIAQIINAL